MICAKLALEALAEFISSHPSLIARGDDQLHGELQSVFAAHGRQLDTFRICYWLVKTYRWPMTDEAFDAIRDLIHDDIKNGP
jgi:hypothetical protein